jgi:hypothetical protein
MRSLKLVVFLEICWLYLVLCWRLFELNHVGLHIFDIDVYGYDRILLLNLWLVFHLSHVVFLIVLHYFKCQVFIQILVPHLNITRGQRNLMRCRVRFLECLHVVLRLILAGKLSSVEILKLFGLGFIDILFFSRLIFLNFVLYSDSRLVILHFLVLNQRLFLCLILILVHYYIPTFCFKF